MLCRKFTHKSVIKETLRIVPKLRLGGAGLGFHAAAYLRYCERKGIGVEFAGTIRRRSGGHQERRPQVTGDYAYGHLRTNVEIGNMQGVLDGDLDEFISASLKQGG